MTTSVKRYVCSSLFRLLLPLILLAACAVRFNALSFLYVICLLICPLLRDPTETTIKGGVGLFLKLLIVISSLGTLSHVIFHIVLASIATSDEPYGYDFANCSLNEKIARQIAVERLDGVPFIHILRLIIPDVAVLVTSILVFVICRKLLQPPVGEEQQLPTSVTKTRQKRTEALLQFFGEFLVVLFLAASGIIVPSALGAFYFLSFLYISTFWALYNTLGKKYAWFRFVVLVWSGLHLCVLHLYQFQFFQETVDPNSLVARVLGLTGVVKTDCSKPWSVEFGNPSQWPWFVNPGVILLLYYTLAVECRHWLHRKYLVDNENPNESVSYSTFDREGSPSMSAAYNSEEEEADGDAGSEPAKNKNLQRNPSRDHQKRPAFVSIFVYAMKQSYVLALIAMMAWSITYHSWLTFVLLLGACLIWMIPKSRHLTLCLSPGLVFYGECLLIIQYVFGMNLREELPLEINGLKLNEVGLKVFEYPCLQLAVQIFFTAMFWLTLRQFMRERKDRSYQTGRPSNLETTDSPSIRSFFSFPSGMDTLDGYDSSTMKQIGAYIWNILSKYWIFVCAGMMLLISVQEVVIYRIIYMFLFLFFVLTFQLSFKLWRVTMFLFWWIVIIYSMAVLIILYTYQFSDFPSYWRNGTKLDDKVLGDLGLEQYDTATLFVKLLTPTSFLIVIIIQVHYFHKPFLILSDLQRYAHDDDDIESKSAPGLLSDNDGAATTDTDTVTYTKTKRWRRKLTNCCNKLWAWGSEWWKYLSALIWRLMEIHVFKVVVFVIIMVAVYEVSAISAVYVIFLAVFLPITGAWPFLAVVCQFWTAVVILAKTIYQLHIVDKDYWITNCSLINGNNMGNKSDMMNMSTTDETTTYTVNYVNPFVNGTSNNAVWVGLDKTEHLSYYIRNYIGILLILVLYKLIKCHQSQHYKKANEYRPPAGVTFPAITRADADDGLLHCAKYFVNYFFYKFGLQLCYIMIAVTICVRVDVFSVIYAIVLGILLILSRRGNALVWPLITIILAAMLPVQYLLCLGLPTGLCIEYPWHNITIFERNLEKWLYLPDYFFPPNAIKLVADLIQLLLICLQWQVFRRESSTGDQYPGGSNKDILPEVEANTPILVADFTGHAKSYLDVVKSGFFSYMYWVTLFIMFITGTTRINLFSMGYVISVFVFMWYGQEFLLQPLRTIRRRWNLLIGYTFFVMFMKAGLQLLGCVFIDKLYDSQCWLIQLLGVTCLNPSHTFESGECKVEEDDTGLAWDVICFTFLLLQLRIYNSHYFRHVVVLNLAQHNLASRGAELINRSLVESVMKQKEEERQVLRNIKTKMDSIREKQKCAKKDFVVPDEHFQTIRSGDYYLFEDDDDDDESDDPEVKHSISLGRDEETTEESPNPIQLITTAIHSGPEAAIDQAEDAEKKDKDGEEQTEEEKVKEKDKKDEDGDDEEEDIIDKTGTILVFISKLLESLCDSIIMTCNNISKNYRMVAAQLEQEVKDTRKKIRSEQQTIEMEDKSIELENTPEEQAEDGQPSTSTDLVEIQMTSVDEDIKETPSKDSFDADKKNENFEKNKHKVYLLLEALYYLLISRTELICYFLMILNLIIYASLLSLPLPLMVFLWGMLSVPRPSKSFWITTITYTEAIIVVKYLFQFGFFPWNKDQTNLEPFWPPRIIGIEKKDGYATVDLVLLLALFIHRSILKRYGLWKGADDITADFADVEHSVSQPGSPLQEENEPFKHENNKNQTSIEDSLEESASGSKKKKEEEPSMLSKLVDPFKDFYNQVTNPHYNATTDVYASMFFCDFINFFIVVFGYTAFGPSQTVGTGDVSSYIQEDKVPIPFLIMLVVQFVLIIVDRALYLRKNVLGKFIFQILLVILLHIWMFFILPFVTSRSFSDNRPAQLWYFVKCVYFGLSAYQIRSSYPTRILGNFLTKKYNYVNLFMYKGFLAIPFLLELRVLMDWVWTDTTMAIGSWLQMEDIYANVYQLKCWREIERKYPTPRGEKKAVLIKYGVGGLLLVVIIFIIWFPLVIFSFANTVFKVNPPTECTVTLSINGFQPIFKVTSQIDEIDSLSSSEYNTLKDAFSGNRNGIAFLSSYEPEDITEIRLNGQSTSVWGISPPSKIELMNQLKSSNGTSRMEFYATFLRSPESADAGETLTFGTTLKLGQKEKDGLAALLNSSSQIHSFNISKLFPRFLKLPSNGRGSSVQSLNADIGLSTVQVSLNGKDDIEWWSVQEVYNGTVLNPAHKANDKEKVADYLTLLTFNDRVAPSGFSFITKYGIIGLYLSAVLVIGRFVRVFFSGSSEVIMFLELPNVDKVINLCLDIYMARECHQWRLEEDLFAKLIFLYRSPSTMIKWTKLKLE